MFLGIKTKTEKVIGIRNLISIDAKKYVFTPEWHVGLEREKLKLPHFFALLMMFKSVTINNDLHEPNVLKPLMWHICLYVRLWDQSLVSSGYF